MSPGSGLISPGGYQGSPNLVILQYGALHRGRNVFRHHRRERAGGVAVEARVLTLSVGLGLLQAAEQVVVLVGGEVVLGLVPVSRGARRVVRTPGHVRQEGLVVSKPLTTPDTSVEMDGPTDEVDHLHLQRIVITDSSDSGEAALPAGRNLNSGPASV